MVTITHELSKPAEETEETFDFPLAGATDPPQESLAFLEHLTEQDQQAFTSSSRQEQHAARSIICREGDPGDALYIIRNGRVAVLKEVGDGRHTLLGYRGAGEIVGEMSLVSQQPRSATLIATEDTELLCVAAADFPSLMDRHPSIGWAILQVLSDRLQAADVARTSIAHEEQALTHRLERLTGETARLAELARVRQDTIEVIAHDLRTPLTVIDGCLQLLRSSLPQEVLETTEDIVALAERSSGRLTTLLEELLTTARQEVSEAGLVREPVDVGHLLKEAVDSAQITARRVSISLSLQVPASLTSPSGDAGQLERVVGNLLDNAIAYTPRKGCITLEAAQVNDEVQISVTDSGPGIAEEYREIIFERFTRVPGSKGRKQGFGLGLHFCQQAIQAHGGRIWVESGPDNVGSRFIFTLPIQGATDGV